MNLLTNTSSSRRSIFKASGVAALCALALRESRNTAWATSGLADDSTSGTAAFLELMRYVDARMEEFAIPSVGVAVVNADKRHTCALGITNVDDPQLVDAETMFRLGPLSQLFTSSAISALAEDGALDLDMPLSTYLPALVDHPVSVRDLMTHRTGWPGTLAFDSGKRDDALQRYVDEAATVSSVSTPGRHFNYVRADSILAGRLIEELSGLRFETALRELTLSTLSMDGSTPVPDEIRGKPVVSGHTRQGRSIVPMDPFQVARIDAPFAGLFSNLNEILQFLSFHAFASAPPTHISAQTRETMHKPHGSGGSAGPVRIDAMGLGWMISEIAGTQVSMLVGAGDGHSGMIAVVPSMRFGVVVLTNADFARDLAVEITYRALDLFCGLQPSPVSTFSRPARELEKLTGTYSVPGGPVLQVSRSGGGLRLDSSHADDSGALSGDLAFVSPLTAMLTHTGSTMFVDFVLDTTGRVGWLRHMGQLSVRSGA